MNENTFSCNLISSVCYPDHVFLKVLPPLQIQIPPTIYPAWTLNRLVLDPDLIFDGVPLLSTFQRSEFLLPLISIGPESRLTFLSYDDYKYEHIIPSFGDISVALVSAICHSEDGLIISDAALGCMHHLTISFSDTKYLFSCHQKAHAPIIALVKLSPFHKWQHAKYLSIGLHGISFLK